MIGDEAFFPISYWAGPPAEATRYQEVAECGFTLAFAGGGTPEEGRQILDWAQQAGLRVLLADPRIHRDLPQQPEWERVVGAVVQDYGQHPALWGYYLTDEPSVAHFPNLAKLTRAFLERDPRHVPYINLFPNYAEADQLGTPDYRAYVRTFVETVRPPVLSYDHYALLEDGDRPEYFENLEIIRAEALRAGIPFWNIILAAALLQYRDPTPADLRYQVYTTLAYGGKGLSYFTYWTIDLENFRHGIISMYGQRTDKFATVQQLNLEMQHLGPHLLGLTSTAVGHWPAAPQGARRVSGEGLVAELDGGQFVVGEFRDASERPWLMVVNRDRERSAYATLRLRTPHREVQEVARSSGALRPIARDLGVEAVHPWREGVQVSFWLAPADGRLLRLGP